jgi:hypothetical protein
LASIGNQGFHNHSARKALTTAQVGEFDDESKAHDLATG